MNHIRARHCAGQHSPVAQWYSCTRKEGSQDRGCMDMNKILLSSNQMLSFDLSIQIKDYTCNVNHYAFSVDFVPVQE